MPYVLAITALPLVFVACGVDDSSAVPSSEMESQQTQSQQEIRLRSLGLPDSFPTPKVPDDNLPSEAKIELGRYLFYDVRLSANQTYSCGTCHQQKFAFTDGLPVAVGSTDESHHFGSMSLVNIAFAASLGWANPTLNTLEAQALIPMFGEEPVELGLSSITEAELLDRIREDGRYGVMFEMAFPAEDDPVTVGNIARAIATFERSIVSHDSPYDRYQAGDKAAMSASAVRGMDLFFSETLECFHCHGGIQLE